MEEKEDREREGWRLSVLLATYDCPLSIV